MKQRKSIKVSKEKAIIIASNHNNIPIQKAKAYTDSELRESIKASQPKARILIPSTPKHKRNQISITSSYIYKAYINTYTYNHQSYKAFRIGLYLRGLLFMC